MKNIPQSMVTDQFGMIGLLTFIRAAETDPNLVAALTLLDTGACPVVTAAPSPIEKPAVDRVRPRPSGKPWRDLADAW